MANLPAKRTSNAPWYPFSEIENLQREMNRLFDFSFPSLHTTDSLLGGQWAPALDVYDGKDNIIVKADLPGMKKDDIEVSVQNDTLTISGEKKRETREKGEDYLRSERFYGSFHRSVALPAGVDPNNVKATFKDGVLELTLAKREEAKPKKINIDIH